MHFILLLIVGLFLEGCSVDCRPVSVGRFQINCQMISLRKKVDAFYGNKQSLEKFTQSYQKAVVLEKYVGEISAIVLQKEAKRIEQLSGRKADLIRLQSIFKDSNFYLKTFVLPVFVEREILRVFQNDPRIHKEAHDAALAYLAAPKKKELKTIPICKQIENHRCFPRSYVQGISDSKLHLVSGPKDFWVFRKVGSLVSYRSFPKQSYSLWLKQELEQVPIKTNPS